MYESSAQAKHYLENKKQTIEKLTLNKPILGQRDFYIFYILQYNRS